MTLTVNYQGRLNLSLGGSLNITSKDPKYSFINGVYTINVNEEIPSVKIEKKGNGYEQKILENLETALGYDLDQIVLNNKKGDKSLDLNGEVYLSTSSQTGLLSRLRIKTSKNGNGRTSLRSCLRD